MPNTEKQKPAYWSIVPATVRYDKSLSASAKLFFTEITALQQKEGYCWASNNYFARLYEVDASTISKWVKILKDSGYIRIEYDADNSRRIYLRERALFYPVKEPDTPKPPAIPPEDAPPGAPEPPPPPPNPTPLPPNTPIEIIQYPLLKKSQDPIEIFQDPIEKTPNRISEFNNKSTAAAPNRIPPEPAEQPPPIPQEQPPPETPETLSSTAAAAEFKQLFLKLDDSFIFDEAFYKRAYAYLAANALGSNFLRWLYELCKHKKPDSLSGYYFSVFFQPRYAEIYRDYLRRKPPPQDAAIRCPVCGAEHPRGATCPVCALSPEELDNPDAVRRGKIIYSWPPDKRAQYQRELNAVQTLPPDMDIGVYIKNYSQTLDAINKKYGI